MIQNISTEEKLRKQIVVFGDMFKWTEKSPHSRGKRFVYLGHEKCFEIPFTLVEGTERASNWDGLTFDKIMDYLQEGVIRKLPRGFTLTITQE